MINQYKILQQLSKLLLLAIFIGVGHNSYAQDEPAEETESVSEESPLKVGIGVEAGTHALGGISFVALYKQRFGLRIGYNNMTVSRDAVELTYSGVDLSNDISVDRSHVFVTADIGLVGKGAVRFVTGVGIMTNNSKSLTVTSRILGSQQVNDIELTSDRIGVLNTNVSTASSANYYVGLGFGRAVPKGRVGFNLDIGAFNLGDLALDIEGTNLLRHNTTLQDQLTEDFNTVNGWWPAVTFRINVRIK